MLNVVRTADVLLQRVNQFLKQFEMSGSQYNVLRILRGSKDGLSCRQISERMISRDPDVTRLLDRLEARSLIGRSRDVQDRRVVMAHITQRGLQFLGKLDPLVANEHQRHLGGLGEAKLRQLIELLEQARSSANKEQETNEGDLPD